MRRKLKAAPCESYSVDIKEEDLVNIYVKQWVLEWCKKYHPEAFEEAEKFVREGFKKVLDKS